MLSPDEVKTDVWAIVELMGHGRTAGIIRTSEIGGLMRVDVPIDDGFRTEFYGASAIYSIKLTSEEIARAYAEPVRQLSEWNEPIAPRSEYESALEIARVNSRQKDYIIEQLRQKLTAVNSLPTGEDIPY